MEKETLKSHRRKADFDILKNINKEKKETNENI